MESSEANIKKIKKCLSNIIGKEETILEYATVKLSVCSPQTGKYFRSFIKEGILCVIINRNTSCLFLKLFELIEFQKVFEIELYTNIMDGYTKVDNYFHVIEFPGFFLGLSFPIIEDPNVANRSALIHKAIIFTSKFISINSRNYIYSHIFDHDKDYLGKIGKMRTYNKNFRSMHISKNKMELMSNKMKFEVNSKDEKSKRNDINGENNEFDSFKKFKSSGIKKSNKSNSNKIKNTESDMNSNNNVIANIEDDDNDSITVTSKKADQNQNYGQEKQSETVSDNNDIEVNMKRNKKKSVFGIGLVYGLNNINPNDNNRNSSTIILQSKEKNLFDSITIEDNENDKKIYKIVQFHILKDKMKLVKKMFQKNFIRFIDPNKISFDNIINHKINTYDFLNDEDLSSEEEEAQKTFVDYVPSKDMFGMLETQDIQDERLMELMQQKNNLKEISKKREDDTPIKTTSIYY